MFPPEHLKPKEISLIPDEAFYRTVCVLFSSCVPTFVVKGVFKLRSKIFFGLFISFCNLANAAGPIGWTKIDSIAFQNSDLMIYTDIKGNPNDCERDVAVILKDSDPNFDKAYAMILAAYMAGKEIRAYSDGCHTFDEKTYNYIRGYKYLQIR